MNHSIKLLSFVLPILLCTVSSQAQEDTIYISSKRRETNKQHASCYRTVKMLSKKKYKIAEYNMNGRIQMSGYYNAIIKVDIDTFINPDKNGVFTFYEDSSLTKTAEGEYLAGRRHGKWQEYYKNSSRLKGEVEYSNGTPNGKTTYYDSLSQEAYIKGFCKDGQRSGTWKIYNPKNGKLQRVVNYGDNPLNATMKDYHENGMVAIEGSYKNDSKDGVWNYYDKKGMIVDVETYKIGLLNGPTYRYSKLYTNLFVFDRYRGDVKHFTDNVLTAECNYVDGVASGIWKTYNEKSGALQTIATYEKGKLNGPYTSFFGTHVLEKGSYTDSVKSGTWYEYYDNTDKVYIVATYENGLRNGRLLQYEFDGHKRFDAEFKNDHLNGTLKSFYPNDSLESTETYEDGVLEGPAAYFDSLTGRKTREVYYFTDNSNIFNFDGYYANYYKPGHIRSEGRFALGEKDGEWKFYTAEGDLECIKNYNKALLQGPMVYYEPQSGNILAEGQCSGNRMNGKWTLYYPGTKQKAVIMNFSNSEPDGAIVIFDSTDHLLCRGELDMNTKNGKWLYYYGGTDSNKIWSSVNFNKDKKDGATEVYYTNGKKMVSQNFIAGSKSAEYYYDETGKSLQAPDLKMRLAIDKIDKRLGEMQAFMSMVPKD